MGSEQAEVNIGLVGHVEHGKTTIAHALTGKWTLSHSEELKRGLTIRLGYADGAIYKCPKCRGSEAFSPAEKCRKCGGKAKLLRRFAIVDAPGHETLMTVMLSGAAIMDGAILVIAANEHCPQPQTYEHLVALNMSGIKNIIIVQNKIDLVSKEKAIKHREHIEKFVKGTVAENAPIIPMAAHYGININYLLEAIEEYIPTPKRDPKKKTKMYIARSFDVNKPGTKIEDLKGGVIGGSIVSGTLKVGDELEIAPGLEEGGEYRTIKTRVVSLSSNEKELRSAYPGGLIGVGTLLDPFITKTDKLVGNLAGKPGEIPEPRKKLDLKINLMERVVGSKEKQKVEKIKMNEMLVVNAGTATSIGTVVQAAGDNVSLTLKRPVCVEEGERIAVSRRIGTRWRLIGYGIAHAGKPGGK